jgi:hypothetical protein
MSYEPRWDIDLREGELAERLVIDLLTDDTIEVKHDRKALQTGNLYVETDCRRRDGWNPSGISTTKATVWFFVLHELDKVLISVRTSTLQRLVAKNGRRRAEEKDGSHPTRGVLVPVRDVLPLSTQVFGSVDERDADAEALAEAMGVWSPS